ncbi:MAG: sulfotransferase domain-containing protein [bacterium]
MWKRTREEVRFDAREFAVELRKDAAGWCSHIENWLKVKGVVVVRYEEMKDDYEGVIRKVQSDITLPARCTIGELRQQFVDEFKPNGDFFRKGIVGDWQNYWNEEHKAIFKEKVGDVLIRLGYENDSNW